jgi:hypothetical protein
VYVLWEEQRLWERVLQVWPTPRVVYCWSWMTQVEQALSWLPAFFLQKS